MARGISGQSVVLACFLSAALLGQAPQPQITADLLRGYVSFLASDALEGRATPSRDLDIAAEYIAAQFRAAGLQPAVDPMDPVNGYFQVAHLDQLGPRAARLRTALGADVVAANPTMRNVAGLLPGSDPVLSGTYVIVSAHYDHVGVAPLTAANAEADRIFNGANDDASGTASVMAVAQAIAAMPQRPARSILFLTFFGEERGLLGSRFYGEHPLVPLARTIAQLNLEQIGRTDGTDGMHLKQANLTGFDFSDIAKVLAEAAAPAGVELVKDPMNSDPFFVQSDNASLAALGIPAHTLSVTYEFPDYHKVSDSWDKLDYQNMAVVDQAIALGVLKLASSENAPKWDEANPATAKFVDAEKKLHDVAAAQ